MPKSQVARFFGVGLGAVIALAWAVAAPAQQTNLAVTVRHAPSLNGNGLIEGSLQQLLGENVTLNGGFTLNGDLFVPGSPALRTNGNPIFGGTVAGTGSTLPSGYQVTLNGNCSLHYLRPRTTPAALPTVTAPPQPAGTRAVTITKAGQSFGEPATLRDLTLNGNTGLVSVPPGTYGNFTVNGGSGLVLGVAGGLQAVNYNLQNLGLNGNATLKVVGPVVLTVANGFTANGTVGASNNPAWLQLRVAGGGFTLNGGCTVYGLVTAPNGTVIVNGNSLLAGTSASDQFTLNGGGVVRWAGSTAQTIQPPVATNQTVTLAENSFTNITLTGSDPQGLTLTYAVLTQPAHGSLSGTPPNVTYRPATNYFGGDAFTFKANNGVTDSAPATIVLIVTQVYYPPMAYTQTLTNFEDTALPITLTGSDPQGYALKFSVWTPPAHGTLSGTAPDLIYLPATNYFGNDAFTFRANDGTSNSAPATISITNQPVDDPPAVEAGPDQLIILPTNTVSLAGLVVFDAFPGTVDTVVWSQVSGPGKVTFGSPSNPMTLATFSTNGIYRLRLYASDSFLSSGDELLVTVDAPPVVNAGLTMTNTFPGTITLPGTASDDGLPTNGTLTVRWKMVSGPGAVVFGDAAATNSPVTFSTNGIYGLRLTADDGIATNHSDITVIENLPPVVNAGANILTNGLQAALNGSASDDGLPGSSLSVQWTQSSGPGTISFGNATATNTAITASQSGTYVLALTAFDGAATNSGEAVVTFNLPPVVNAGTEQTINFGAPVTLAGTATDDQLPHNILNCAWTEVSGPGNAIFADATLTNTTVTFDQPGIYALRLAADDSLAATSADILIKVNTAPVVSAGAGQTVTLGTPAVLAGSVSDDGLPGPTVATEWTQVSGPAGASFADSTAASTSVNFSQTGVYVFRLTADDGLTNSSAGVTITVVPAAPVNHPPVAPGQSLSATENAPLNITLTGTDVDGDVLTFTVATQPAHGALSGTAPNLTYIPATDYTGSDSFTFKVDDGRLASAPATVAINVTAASALQLNVPGDQEVLQDAPLIFADGRRITINGNKASTEALILSLSVSNGTLTLDSMKGLAVTSGANGTGDLVVTGSKADLNAALDGMSYLGNPYFVGTDAVVVEVEEPGASGSKEAKVVPITVLPILTFINLLTGAVQNTPFVITYNDLYWNSDIGYEVSFKVESLTSGALTRNGEPLEYGTSLISQDESVIWTPPADAIGQVEAFRVVAWDGVHQSSNSVPVVVELHAPMHLNVPGKQTIPHNMALVFGTGRLISITDEDPGLGELELSLSVSGGTLTLGRVDGLDWQAGANGTSAQIVRGSLADLNAALAGLTYLNTAGFSGTDLLNLAVDDLGNNDLGVNFKNAKTIPIAVLAPPNSPPKVSIVVPADTSLFQSGQTIAVEAAAVDSDGQITKVTLFADGLELAELTGPPFAATWTGAALGRHVLSAAATDDRGATAVSSAVAIWVLDESGDLTVEAGPDQIVSLPNAAFLAGTVIIQTPVAGSQTNVTWSKLDGPGDVQFSDANVLAATAQFSEPGSYVLRLQVAYAGGIRSDLLKVDVLPPPPNRLTAARSNRGSDFWLTFLSNVQPYFESPYIGQNLYVSASVDTAGTVTCFDGWALQEQRFQVRAGSSTTIPLCLNSGSFAASDSIQDNAIHVTTDHPVALYGLNYEYCTTDGYLALPTTMLGTDYLVLAYRNSPGWQDPQYIAGGTQFAVVAAENDTSVTITPSASAGSRTAGVPYEIVLQQGETYRLINYDDPAADFTGTAIHSDNPVAVFGGHECALVPVRVGTADHLVEQLPPVNEWGRHFVTMPLATRTKGDTFRFLAATNGTRVVINGQIVASLDRGQYLERIIDGPAEILANKPILMAQYANGCTFDNDSGHGDPFMMLIPPFEQFGGDYILSTAQIISHQQDPSFEVYTDYLNLTVSANGAGSIILDDVPIPAADFQLIGNSGYAGAQLPLTPGAHHLSAPAPFGACVYGWAWCESYAFMGGFYSETAEPDTKVELTQPTPFAAVGHEKTVFARVTNGRGSPLPDMELTFSVSGANTATGHALTSRFGQAAFSYMGTNAGEDVITVSLAEFNQSVTNTWIAGSDNSPPVVSTTDTPPLQFSLTAQLAGTVGDDGRPPGAPMRFGWRFLGGSGEVQIENTNLLSTRAFCSEPGTYLFELAADDSQFSSRSVASVTVVRPFTVTVGGVDPGSWFSTNASLQLCANIDMLDGVYTNVEFFDHDVKLSEGLSTSVTVDSPSPGEHSITVVVTEEHGLQVRSEPLEFFVTFPPQIDVLLPDHDLTLPYDNPTATFKARAWEPDGTIANFAVYVGSGLVYQTNGDQIDFTGLVHDGIGVWFDTWPVHFIATDNHGISTDVFAANANLLPPTTSVNFVTPHNGDSFRLGQTVDFVIQASVTPPARVTDGQLAYYRTWGWWMWWSIEGWRWDNGSPTPVTHQSHWMPTETGDVDVRVKISTDASSWQESVVTIRVLPALGVSISSPTNSEQRYVGTPSPIVLALDDPTGVFDRAEFFADGTSLGQTTNVWWEWTPSQIGNHTLTAKVYDHQGQTYNADAPVTIQAVPPPPPDILITSPKNGDRLAVEQETLVAVDVNDPAQAVTNLELLVDGIKVTDSLDSYIPWTPASTGNHTLTVVAADWNGNRVTSAPVTLAVVEMHPPTVTIISPADGVHYTVETLPPLHAEAADSDGTVTNLILELDGAVLSDTNGATLELTATNILGGWHTVLARATDNDGLTGASASVSFFIERSVDANLPVPAQLAAEALSATEIGLNWQPLPTNTPAGSVLVERWDPNLSAWIEVGKVVIAETNYTDPSLNPETCYRYRVATTDNIVHRSACSEEAQATTRTVVPHYSVIDLTEALIASLTGPSANILTNSGLHDFDSRRSASLGGGHAESALGTNATALKLAAARFKERWPQIQLDYDPVLLSPKSILPRLGYLTGPGGAGVTVSDATAQLFDPNDPDRPVKAFLQEYKVLFGFRPEALADANVQRDYVSAGNGARTVVWQQQLAGVPVFNALLIGHLTQAGELACLSSEFIPSPAQAADPALLAAVQSGAGLPLSAPQALVTAVTNVGDRFTAGSVTAQTDATGIIRRQTFTASTGFKGEAQAELTWFPADRAQLKLCWQVLFTSQWRDEMVLTLVAADTGEIVYRRTLTAESSGATFRVYTNASPAPLLPGWSVPDTTQPPTVQRGLVTLAALDDTASPNGWIADGDNETRGNNVDAHLDRNDDNVADLPRPTGNPWRVFDFPLDLTTAPANYGEAATVQLFYWDNWMHDALYQFGFTEAAGNFQTDNFGRGGLGNDAVQADAQDGLGLNDGRHANNANMSTPPDGCAPRMQMYVFDGASPGRDGSLDAQIVLHEYTHGLSTRLVGGGAGIDALQTAGMGEGWSDFYALALLADPAADVDGVYPMASYAAYHGFGTTFEENYYYGIRRYPYCTDTNKNPLTFADIDPAKAYPHDGVPRNPLLGPFRADQAGEVHAQGEVWCMMLWEMRANLIRKLGPDAGHNLALQLVTDGLKLSPPNPNFVQARDAILLADRMWSGGVNATEIWNAFAKRGLGFNARAPESYTTSGVQESRDLMPALAAERVEIQTTSGAIELGVNNNLLIHLRNQGDATATHVSGQLATAGAGVSVVQSLSTYADIPQGGTRANDTVFRIQTGAGFVEGTPIDLAFAIGSDQSAGTNYLRLFTGVPGAEILFDDYSALADPGTASSATKDLTPLDIAQAEPLWMADDASCLLKVGAGKYLLWRFNAEPVVMLNDRFLAHRLTRQGLVVGRMEADLTLDIFGNRLTHTYGAKWTPGEKNPVALTLNGDGYRFPKGCSLYDNVGSAYDLTVTPPNWLGFVADYPTLQDVWDMDSGGQAVGAASVYFQPLDANHNGSISRTELEFSRTEMHEFAADGTLNWLTVNERGASAGYNSTAVMRINYNAMLTSAAQFDILGWRWLGPLNFSPGNSLFSTALLANDIGTIAGYGAVQTGNPAVDALWPTHAFRVAGNQEFSGTAPILQDLGVLPGGIYSFPRAINPLGQIAGYSQYQPAGSVPDFHGVFWDVADTAPQDLRSLTQVKPEAPLAGSSDAYAINNFKQIVGTSHRAGDSASAAVLWQYNYDTNGTPFWEITDLNQRLRDPDWYVFNAVGINDDGLILADALKTTLDQSGNVKTEEHAALLVTAQLAVDANRDGQITFDDADSTTPDNPYRFWLNDDQDESAPSNWFSEDEPEVYPPSRPDSGDQIINSARDCEDLTRLWLDAGNLVNYLADGAGDFYVGLKWENIGDTRPSIRLFQSADTSGGLGHIKDATVAARQADPAGNFSSCLKDADFVSNGIDQVRPTDRVADFIFTKHIFADLTKSQSKLYLLFEGVAEGKGELRLVFLKKNSDGSWASLGGASSVWLNLQNIRRMYVRTYSTPLPENFPLPWQDAACKNPPAFPYQTNWMTGSLYIPMENLGYGIGDSTPSDENQAQYPFDAPPDEQKKCVVFVHGIDVTVAEQQGYAQSFYKRLWWEGYRGRLVAFRWATTLDSGSFTPFADRENFSIFNSGEYRSWYGGNSLLKYVTQLHADLGNEWVISIAAHSLGNACVGEALRLGMKVNSYVAMEAAVPLSCYYPETEDLDSLMLTEPSLVRADATSPTPQFAGELGYQGYLSDFGNNPAINRASYYNAVDFWLVVGHLKPTKGNLPVNWMSNQRNYKPDNRLGPSQYKYDSLAGLPRLASFERGLNYSRSVTDPFEAMSFISRSRTRPLGAGEPPPKKFQGLNLISIYNFDRERSSHSGQFQRNIQLMYGNKDGKAWADESGRSMPFYLRLMNDLRVSP